MIDLADFVYAMDNPAVSPEPGPGGLLPIIPGPAMHAQAERFNERLREWWHSEGVVWDAISAWSMDQAQEDLGGFQLGVMLQDPMALMGAQLSTAYTLGFTMGWRLRAGVRAPR